MPSALVTFTPIRDLDAVEKNHLSNTELKRLADIGAPRRQQEYLCSRTLLRKTLERWTGKPAASHQISNTDSGKPFCVDGPAISVAHSGDIVACAVTDSGEIGIDLENPKRRRRTAAIARNFFSGDEADWLATQPESRFYMLWVLKEAHAKATGQGLAGLDHLHCTVEPPRIEADSTDGSVDSFSLYEIGDSYLALAARHGALCDVAFDTSAINADFRKIATTHDVA